jgi:UDP-N-acetylglucosamine--N-acetylmuramyl-(pentapeptide) pyrophosphoryl-undecaprenol N-acetylglucosamine transferase
MTIVLTGGGSGGHITPVLAVANELKKIKPGVKLVYIGQTGDSLADVPRAHQAIDEVYTVRAGKFRRYNGEGWRQILDISTLVKNIRDFFYVFIGIFQSSLLLKKLKPDVIFIKGGFVGVPVGLAAAMRNIPFVTHDSDAMPGLANRIIGHWAAAHAVALPKDVYNYPADKTYVVGVPVSEDYVPVTANLQRDYRQGLNIKHDERVICVTGGGLGAHTLNMAVAAALPELLHQYPGLAVFHIAGRNNEAELRQYYAEHLDKQYQPQVVVKGFVNDLYRYSAAADVIITRAGATTLAEFAIQAKPVVVVPNPALTGGHQLKNAEYLAAKGAVEVVLEADLAAKPEILADKVGELLHYSEKREELAHILAGFANPDASKKLADVILQTAADRS